MITVDDLLKELRIRCNNKYIELPKTIKFEYDEEHKTLNLQMKKGIYELLQNDSAAFEGWALCFKANLPEYIYYVVLDWDKSYEPNEKTKSGWKHFNRFLYRLDRFSSQYKDWFIIVKEENKRRWSDLLEAQGWTRLVLNKPEEKRKNNIIEYGFNFNLESHLEEYFKDKGSAKLTSLISDYGIEISEIKNQLPVGVFYEKISNGNYIFTGRKSAIDLYGVDSKNKSFNIFELKGPRNVKVGIITETFFYASVIKDAIDGIFQWEYSQIIKEFDVNAFFFVKNIHPLITDNVIQLLNVPNNGVTYRKLFYTDNELNIEG